MRLFTCTTFNGHYPVGTAAVVVASDPETAVLLLESNLTMMGLPQTIKISDLTEVSMLEDTVLVLCDGNY